MKWMRWIASVLTGTTKSMGTLGVGLRAALGGGAPGGWASDHREETAHNTGFNYIAIHSIASQVAGATVTVFADGDQSSRRQSQRKSLAAYVGSFTRWKSLYGADDRETDPLPMTHPLVRLLKRPNPQESGASFRYRQAQQIRLTGTCLIWNVPSVSGPTCERYVIPTAMASPVAPTRDLPRGGWQINPVASRYTPIIDDDFVDCPSWYRILGQIVDARQVQVIRLPHAWYLDDGQSPLSAGAKWVDAGEAVDEARYHQLKNGIDPSVVWNLPPDVSPDQDEMDRVQAKISAKYGGPENVGRVMVAQSGTSVTPLSTSPKEMCYSEGFQDFKSAVLALHQTPPVAVGLQEPGAYAAYNASMKAWRHAAIQPLCDLLAESDTEHLAPEFGVGLTVEIESDTVDDTDLIERQLENDLAAKVRTKNEWRAVRGMPPLPGTQGDELVGTESQHAERTPEAATMSSKVYEHDRAAVPKYFGRAKAELPLIGINQWNSDDHSDTPPVPALPENSSASDETLELRDLTRSVGTAINDDQLSYARSISKFLYGLFAESGLPRWAMFPLPTQKSFDPLLHPRDERGRFTRALKYLSSILSTNNSAADVEQTNYYLSLLPTSALTRLLTKHDVVPVPRTREGMERSFLVRHDQFPMSEARTFPNRSRSRKVTVHIQNPEIVNQRVPFHLDHEVKSPLTRKQWARLVGAQPGAKVHVFPRGLSSVVVFVDHPDYLARRTLSSSRVITNDFMIVAPNKQKRGIAIRILSQQVKTASELGYHFVNAGAAGNGTKILVDEDHWHLQGLKNPNGYYTWARFGFSGKIRPLMRSRAKSDFSELREVAADFKKRFPQVTDVSELMLTKKGRDWWSKYGGYFEGRFDLRENSRSRKILAKYRAEKAAKSKQKSLMVESHSQWAEDEGPTPSSIRELQHNFDNVQRHSDRMRLNETHHYVEYSDPLTSEDEEILDRIWDQFAAETTAGIDMDDGGGYQITAGQ